MAREGWSTKLAATVLGVHRCKVTQVVNPSIRKVAMLMLADPLATHIELVRAMEILRAQRARENAEDPRPQD